MSNTEQLTAATIKDFGEQWSKFTDNEGWYGSLELFRDIVQPLINPQELMNQTVADIGSGTGRIVNMLLSAGAKQVYAIEPAEQAYAVLQHNLAEAIQQRQVVPMNCRGDVFTTDQLVDYVFSIGVLHHIPDPGPTMRRAYEVLKPGGYCVAWIYGYEGNEQYLSLALPLRTITTHLPHGLLRGIVEILYWALLVYRWMSRWLPLPLRDYLHHVLWPMTPLNRRQVIYDQLNPAYSKYYQREEALKLFADAGFENIEVHHRRGYSWTVKGRKSQSTP